MTSQQNVLTMTAVAYRPGEGVTDPSRLVDVTIPRPTPGPRDLLVEVRAVSVNPVDLKVQGGSDDLRVLGFDAAGVVASVGEEVTLFSPGDEVWYAGNIARPGTDAELHAVDERIVGRKPTSLTFGEAAAMPLTAITAWEALFEKLRLDASSTGSLLVVGASGGVGSMILQLAEALLPRVRVIATSSSREADDWVRSLGAEETVDHRAGDLQEQIRAVAPEGVDWVFTTRVADPDQLPLYVDVLKPFGHVVAIDDPDHLDVAFLKGKSLTLHWELMFTKPLAGGDLQIAQHHLLDQVADLVDAGRIRTTARTVLSPIDATRLREAHRLVEGGRTIGKIALTR